MSIQEAFFERHMAKNMLLEKAVAPLAISGVAALLTFILVIGLNPSFAQVGKSRRASPGRALLLALLVFCTTLGSPFLISFF